MSDNCVQSEVCYLALSLEPVCAGIIRSMQQRMYNRKKKAQPGFCALEHSLGASTTEHYPRADRNFSIYHNNNVPLDTLRLSGFHCNRKQWYLVVSSGQSSGNTTIQRAQRRMRAFFRISIRCYPVKQDICNYQLGQDSPFYIFVGLHKIAIKSKCIIFHCSLKLPQKEKT